MIPITRNTENAVIDAEEQFAVLAGADDFLMSAGRDFDVGVEEFFVVAGAADPCDRQKPRAYHRALHRQRRDQQKARRAWLVHDMDAAEVCRNVAVAPFAQLPDRYPIALALFQDD